MCKTITDFSKCNCEAITVYFDNGENNSLLQENLSKFNIYLEGIEELNKTYCCNHCVNNYGLDLCGCGSGETPENCDGDFDQCGSAYETFGESVKFNPKFLL